MVSGVLRICFFAGEALTIVIVISAPDLLSWKHSSPVYSPCWFDLHVTFLLVTSPLFVPTPSLTYYCGLWPGAQGSKGLGHRQKNEGIWPREKEPNWNLNSSLETKSWFLALSLPISYGHYSRESQATEYSHPIFLELWHSSRISGSMWHFYVKMSPS